MVVALGLQTCARSLGGDIGASARYRRAVLGARTLSGVWSACQAHGAKGKLCRYLWPWSASQLLRSVAKVASDLNSLVFAGP